MKYLSKSEIRAAIEKAAKSSERNYIIINTLAKTGVRVSELTAIKDNDILESSDQIIIRGKGDKIRNIDVDSELILWLKMYVKKNKIKKNKPIFALGTRQIRNITQRFANTNPHSFRHSYAIQLLRKTMNVRYVQVQLGHSTLATTQIYLRFMDFNKEKEKLGELWT